MNFIIENAWRQRSHGISQAISSRIKEGLSTLPVSPILFHKSIPMPSYSNIAQFLFILFVDFVILSIVQFPFQNIIVSDLRNTSPQSSILNVTSPLYFLTPFRTGSSPYEPVLFLHFSPHNTKRFPLPFPLFAMISESFIK